MSKKNIALLSTFFFLVPSVQAKNWTGYYLGLNAGYNSGDIKIEGLSTSDPDSIFRKIAEDIPRAGDFTSDVPAGGKLKVGSSFGIQLGHLQETNSPWVFGWEVSFNRFKNKNHSTPFIMRTKHPFVNIAQEIKFDGGHGQIRFDAKLKGIIGYKVKQNFLPYISLGTSFTKINYQIGDKGTSCVEYNGSSPACENLANYTWVKNGILSEKSYFNYSYNYGVGLFYMLTDNISLNMEINRNHLRPFNGYMNQRLSGKYTNYRLGLNYHF